VSKLLQGKFDRVANFVAKARSRSSVLSLNTGYQENPVASIPALEGIGPSGELVPLQRHLSVKKKQLIRGVLLGACVTAAVTLGAIKYSGYRYRAGGSAPARAQAAPLKSDAQTLPQASAASSAPSSAAADIFNSGKETRGTLPKSTPSNQVAAFYAHAQSQTQTLEPKAPIQSARMPGQLEASGTRSSSKKQMTPAQLWASVQAGNSKAAVTLAELYIKGEGVAQNCQQARILLLVASEKRNEAAIKRLHELDQDKDTCP
jgi:TPR repeat protein